MIVNKQIVAKDVNERQILDAIAAKAQIIVTPIGGQASSSAEATSRSAAESSAKSA